MNGWAKDVTLEWDPNTEPDLGGYIVHYGSESGVYDNSLDVGNFTSAVISGLDPDADYYFAVSAYNLDGLTGALSEEVPDVVGHGERSLSVAAMTSLNAFNTWRRKLGKAAAEFYAWSQ